MDVWKPRLRAALLPVSLPVLPMFRPSGLPRLARRRRRRSPHGSTASRSRAASAAAPNSSARLASDRAGSASLRSAQRGAAGVIGVWIGGCPSDLIRSALMQWAAAEVKSRISLVSNRSAWVCAWTARFVCRIVQGCHARDQPRAANGANCGMASVVAGRHGLLDDRFGCGARTARVGDLDGLRCRALTA